MLVKTARPWTPELLLLAASICMLLVGNRRFLELALAGRAIADPSSWIFGGALVLALLALNFLLLALLAWGRLFKLVVAAVLLLTAATAHFIDSFGAFIDPAMLRNALHTHWGEASELIGPRLASSLLLGAVLPVALLARLPVARRSWRRFVVARGGALALALLALVAAIWVAFQPLASLMRNQRELRYLVTPGNLLWSATALAHRASREPAGPLAAVGRDAQAGPTLMTPLRPRVVVLVVGETARAANWGLNGYLRQTTPELARLPVINFTRVTSCGTDTETSLPCMFAAVGRRDYNERRIRGSENLLHVLAAAGVGVHWRDNQSGCKGVCDGFPTQFVRELASSGLCAGDSCLDEGLLHGLPQQLTARPGPQLMVLHQLGNHGPSYYRRVPPAFERFKPICTSDDLRHCTTEEIVNAYDNALLYTDHVLAQLIGQLQALSPQLDSAVIYVSDHGESLGERGLYLHGMPHAVAPDVQTQVPMVIWLSEGFAAARGLDRGCLVRQATRPASHDHLFHTVLGLLDVDTRDREPTLDLSAGCLRTSP